MVGVGDCGVSATIGTLVSEACPSQIHVMEPSKAMRMAITTKWRRSKRGRTRTSTGGSASASAAGSAYRPLRPSGEPAAATEASLSATMFLSLSEVFTPSRWANPPLPAPLISSAVDNSPPGGVPQRGKRAKPRRVHLTGGPPRQRLAGPKVQAVHKARHVRDMPHDLHHALLFESHLFAPLGRACLRCIGPCFAAELPPCRPIPGLPPARRHSARS